MVMKRAGWSAVVGLDCCPISKVRNHAAQVSAWLDRPEWVIPFAGFCMGRPAGVGRISLRLPLPILLHRHLSDRLGGSHERRMTYYGEHTLLEFGVAHMASCGPRRFDG